MFRLIPLVLIASSIAGLTVQGADNQETPKEEPAQYKPELEAKDLQELEHRLKKYAEETQSKPAASSTAGEPARTTRNKKNGKEKAKHNGLFQRLDADGDGQLNDQERKRAEKFLEHLAERKNPFTQRMLKKFDADSDGKLNATERDKALNAIEKGLIDFGDMRKKMLKKFDADGDGKLNEEERAKAQAAMAKRKKNRSKPKPKPKEGDE